MNNPQRATSAGITIGSVLAVVLSMQVNNHIGYAILHGICSWIYVIYNAVTYR